jgi:hypothetical protein
VVHDWNNSVEELEVGELRNGSRVVKLGDDKLLYQPSVVIEFADCSINLIDLQKLCPRLSDTDETCFIA